MFVKGIVREGRREKWIGANLSIPHTHTPFCVKLRLTERRF